MPSDVIYSTARIGAHPIHSILVPIPIACFAGGLLTDLVYWRTSEIMWADFSAWLVTVGTIVAWLAAIAGADRLFGKPCRARTTAGMAACHRQCRGADLGDDQHAHSQS